MVIVILIGLRGTAAAVAQWVRVFASQAEGWVYEFQPRQTFAIKTVSDTSTAQCIQQQV